MKITKRQLKRIIAEEKQLLEYSEYLSWQDLADHMNDIADQLEDLVMRYAADQGPHAGWLQSKKEGGTHRAGPIKRAMIELMSSAKMISKNIEPAWKQDEQRMGRMAEGAAESRKLINESESYVYRTRSGELRISDDEGNDEPYPSGESQYGYLQPGQGETVIGGNRGRGGYGYGGYSSRRRRRY